MLPDRALTGVEPESVQITLLKATLHHVPDTPPLVVVVFTLAMVQLEREKTPKTLYSPLAPSGILEDTLWITILPLSLFI